MASQQLAQTVSMSQAIAPQAFDYDLAIVGGGIIGLTLACALKDSGLSILLIEAQAESVAVAKGRAYVISLLSGRIFSGIGVWDEILPQISTFGQISLSDADYDKVVYFEPQELGTNGLGYAAEHRVLLSALQNQLKNSKNVSFLCPAEVIRAEYQADGVEIELLLSREAEEQGSRGDGKQRRWEAEEMGSRGDGEQRRWGEYRFKFSSAPLPLCTSAFSYYQ